MIKKNLQIESGLSLADPIIYRHDGNRACPGEEILLKAQSYAEKIGISSMSKISSLIDSPIPVYMSGHASKKGHYLFGGAYSSLGKGSTDLQSKISCLMEAIENHSAGVIPTSLIRADFNYLSKTHLVVDPSLFFRLVKNHHPQADENIMWTRAYCPSIREEVLIPAELVYFPFENEIYDTKSYFISSSNGLASGATYLEATIHALYELIERAVYGYKELKMGFNTPIDADEIFADNPHYQKARDLYGLKFYLVESFILPSIPVVECIGTFEGKTSIGHGCALNFMMAMERALAEAVQSLSIFPSGAREDLLLDESGHRETYYAYSLKKVILESRELLKDKSFSLDQTLSKSDLLLKFSSLSVSFSSLNEEYSQLLDYLIKSGHGDFYLVNLSPEHSDLVVVKAISSSLMSKPGFYGLNRYEGAPRTSRMASFYYRNMNKI